MDAKQRHAAIVAAVVAALFIPSTGAVVAIRKYNQNARLDEIQAQVEPLLGQTRGHVVAAIGPPMSVVEQGELTVFRYLWVGSTHSFAAGTAGGTAWQDADQIDITFRGDTATSWRAKVMR